MPTSKNFLVVLLIIILAGLSVFLGIYNYTLRSELKAANASLELQKNKSRSLAFAQSFIKLVLKAEKEVDFETRLKLENLVRDLKDQKILDTWQKFVTARNETQAQAEVKNLLELLIDKSR